MYRAFAPFAAALVVGAASCDGGSNGDEPADLDLAGRLASSKALGAWADSAAAKPTILYVDRSGSMRGFLDPDYPTHVRTDYRSVIDGLVVGLKPGAAFGFGSQITSISPSLGTLGDRSIYSDNNTELESALDSIGHDTSLSATHIVVGDGRRSNPNIANEQYVRIRSLADQWIRSGGTFMVAASMAPFKPVPEDPSGCRRAGGDAGRHPRDEDERGHGDDNAERGTCPLYAFAYVAPGQQARIAAVLADRFEHLFVWPLPAVAPDGMSATEEGSPGDVQLERGWSRAADRTPILRTRGPQFSNHPLRLRLSLRDSTSPLGLAESAALRGQALRSELAVKPLEGQRGEWTPNPAHGSLLRAAGDDPLAFDAFTRGADQPRYLYRVELYPTGVPTWLERFDAESAGDELRTYGLGRLFELFRTAGEQPGVPPAGRIYLVAN
jgi:hypothetical protein